MMPSRAAPTGSGQSSKRETNMKNQRNEIEPPPAEGDDFDFEDFGPDDLERIRNATPMQEDDDSYEEWEDDPWEQMRREEQLQWLRDLADPDDPSVRVVELKPFLAVVVEGRVLYVVSHEKWTRLGPLDPRHYSDEELREKANILLPFL